MPPSPTALALLFSEHLKKRWPSAGRQVKLQGCKGAALGLVNWYNHFREQCGTLQNTEEAKILQPNSFSLRYTNARPMFLNFFTCSMTYTSHRNLVQSHPSPTDQVSQTNTQPHYIPSDLLSLLSCFTLFEYNGSGLPTLVFTIHSLVTSHTSTA